jgi:hypothetical protein
MLLSVDQSIQLVRKAGRQASRVPLVLPPSESVRRDVVRATEG